MEQIAPTQLAAWLEQARSRGTPVLLDVREPQELALARVPENGFALHCIPMQSVPQRLHELSPTQAIAVLCHHGARSQQVALYLASQGFDYVANIAGGIDAWSVQLDRSIPRY